MIFTWEMLDILFEKSGDMKIRKYDANIQHLSMILMGFCGDFDGKFANQNGTVHGE